MMFVITLRFALFIISYKRSKNRESFNRQRRASFGAPGRPILRVNFTRQDDSLPIKDVPEAAEMVLDSTLLEENGHFIESPFETSTRSKFLPTVVVDGSKQTYIFNKHDDGTK